MNGKSCLLCGKSLARIRVGSGGDFCSREHRDEYRLRRSIDCLTEANKVATLARRREAPKPVFAEPTPGLASAAPRPLDSPGGRGLGAGLSVALPRIDEAMRRNLIGAESARAAWPPATDPQPRMRLRPGSRQAGVPREIGFRAVPARPLRTPECRASEWKPRISKGEPIPAAGMAALPLVGNALRVSASAPLRPGALAVPRVTTALAREKTGLRRDSRVRLLAPSSDGEAPAARLGYVELAFTAASDAPARLDWIGKRSGREPGQEL